MRAAFVAIFIILISEFCPAQTDSVKKVPYSMDFRFADGFYINYEQVLANKPISYERIISDKNQSDFDYISEQVSKEKIEFADDLGMLQQFPVKSLWGYCRNNVLYINYSNEFNRIPVVGRICHFVAEVTVVHQNMGDPFLNNYNYPISSGTYATKEMSQFIFDFDSGKVLPFESDDFESVLARDPELYEEYLGLSRKKRKTLRFVYLRKYNERNPLYINSTN